MTTDTYKKLFTFLHQTEKEYCSHLCTKDCPLSQESGTSICSSLAEKRRDLGHTSEVYTDLVHDSIRKAIVDFSDKVG